MTDIKAVNREYCHADRDGDCEWEECPQLVNRQEYCPLAKLDDEEFEEYEKSEREEKPLWCSHPRAYATSQSSVGMWASMCCPDCGDTWYWDPY